MRAFLLVALGGVAGANARFLVSLWAARWQTRFPAGTLLVNVTGTLLLGFTVAYLAGRLGGSTEVQLLIGTGFCGSYTTFSTLAFETVVLARQRDYLPAVLNISGNLVLGLLAGLGGIYLGSSLT